VPLTLTLSLLPYFISLVVQSQGAVPTVEFSEHVALPCFVSAEGVLMQGMMAACRGSPTSQKICFRHVKAARNMSLAKVLEEDYRLLHHMCHISNDFVEGIRAKLIEKDNNARWKPATVDEVVAPLLLVFNGWNVCSSTAFEPHCTNSMYSMLSSGICH